MEQLVTFYRLSRKVINQQDAIPADARQVLYYSLAIGHHVGVMDCFEEIMQVPADAYRRCLELMPQGAARTKLEGAVLWEEIEINRSHADELLPALNAVSSAVPGADGDWVRKLVQCMQGMLAEPALYVMVRMRE